MRRLFIHVTASWLLLVTAVALPIASWEIGQDYLAGVAARNPVPDQNAMLLELLGFCASCVLALLLLVGAIVLLVRGLNRTIRAKRVLR